MLVCKDQELGLSEVVLIQHPLEFLPGLDNTISVIAIDDKDDALGILEVMSPQRSDFVLPTNIPNGELNVLIFDSLDVEANGGDGSDNFTQSGRLELNESRKGTVALLQFVEDGRLSSSVKAHHQNSHLLLPHESVKQL